MALNASGAISLAGSTAGQSIAVELGLSATAQISMNCTVVRTLAGIASGPIAFDSFYGKSNGPSTGIYYGGSTSATVAGSARNEVTRIDKCGALIGSQTNIGTARYQLGGAGMDTNGMYWGGASTGNNYFNTATRIGSNGALVGTETTPTAYGYTPSVNAVGARVGTNGLYLSSVTISPAVHRVTRINSSGALVGSTNVSVTLLTSNRASAAVGVNGLFYGGQYQSGNPCCSPTYADSNLVLRVNACGTKVGSCTNVGTARSYFSGARVGVNGLFFGGYLSASPSVSTVTRINACGAIVGSQTTVSLQRSCHGGSLVGELGVFFGGYVNFSFSTATTRVNACGAQVGSNSNISATGRKWLAGASV
jgi:hypothetical protein